MGVLLWRGFGIDQIMAQCFGNEDDKSGKGRQMPVVRLFMFTQFLLLRITSPTCQHFGSPTHHFHTISSPLATQIPQAAGVGYALKRDPARRNKNIAAVYFGEGAASEGDFHAGMLFASTIPSPTLFIARNNGFAISTPSTEQYYGDGIAARGHGYGIDTVRVDGNDVLAVLSAVREARKRCLESGRAVLLEAMSYRWASIHIEHGYRVSLIVNYDWCSVGHHSTSDDSYAYRARAEVEDRKRIDNPISRFKLFLESQGWWNEEEEEALKAKLRKDVLEAFKKAEGMKRHNLGALFTDVYGGEEPWNIVCSFIIQ
jgi:2-oxoisovalerate dehydrogenase E1 component alpha subunit